MEDRNFDGLFDDDNDLWKDDIDIEELEVGAEEELLAPEDEPLFQSMVGKKVTAVREVFPGEVGEPGPQYLEVSFSDGSTLSLYANTADGAPYLHTENHYD